MNLKPGLHILTAILCAFPCASRLRAQGSPDPEILRSRALDAIRRATIAAGDMQPYRLTALITTYDGAGKNPLEGTVTITRLHDLSRIDTAFPAASASSLYTHSGEYRSTTAPLPYYAALMIRTLQQPVDFQGFDAEPAPAPPSSAVNEPLNCIALVANAKERLTGSTPSRHELCLAPPADQIRLLIDDDEIFLRDNILLFDHHDVARRLRLRLGGITVAEIIISSLDPATLTPADFEPART